jgi:PAS domain-containing protein
VASRSPTKRSSAGHPRAGTPNIAALQAGLDRLPIGFALFDAKRRLVAWNGALASICGYPKSF